MLEKLPETFDAVYKNFIAFIRQQGAAEHEVPNLAKPEEHPRYAEVLCPQRVYFRGLRVRGLLDAGGFYDPAFAGQRCAGLGRLDPEGAQRAILDSCAAERLIRSCVLSVVAHQKQGAVQRA